MRDGNRQRPSARPAHTVRRSWRSHRKLASLIGATAALLIAVAVTVATADAATQDGIPAGAVRAADFADQSGAQVENTGDVGGGKNVGWLSNGDWMRYDSVTLGASGAVMVSLRIAAACQDRPGSIEVRLDAVTGPLVASVPTAYTGAWQDWVTVAGSGTSPGGVHSVFLVMRSAQTMDFVNVNWFAIGTSTTGSVQPSGSAAASATPASSSAPGGTNGPSASAPVSTPAAPGGSGWVPVDEVAWQQELAQFHAIAPLPIPAGTTMVPEFHTDCTVSGHAPDDPIVFPDLPGASHEHTFFGPAVNAFTTPASLFTESTSCTAPGDNAAYWVPTLLHNGTAVPIKSFRVYYGSRLRDPGAVVPFPPGLVMVQGDAKRQVATPAGASGQFWCAGSAEVGRSADGNWPVCAPGGNLIFQLVFQDCWDGKHIDSPDHKSHMGPAQNGVCTGNYPVAVPDLSFMVNYESLGGDGLALSSGMASSMHGDFMNAWDPAKLGALVKICLNASAKCGTTPTFTGG